MAKNLPVRKQFYQLPPVSAQASVISANTTWCKQKTLGAKMVKYFAGNVLQSFCYMYVQSTEVKPYRGAYLLARRNTL
jgi:hypothetical protein